MKTDGRSSGEPRRARGAFGNKLRIALATAGDRDVVYKLRHDVFARELAQHAENAERRLTDALDEFNIYITASLDEEIAGFISVRADRNRHPPTS